MSSSSTPRNATVGQRELGEETRQENLARRPAKLHRRRVARPEDNNVWVLSHDLNQGEADEDTVTDFGETT